MESNGDEDDALPNPVLEYWKKHSRNRELAKFFSGTSVSYLPQTYPSSDEAKIPEFDSCQTGTSTDDKRAKSSQTGTEAQTEDSGTLVHAEPLSVEKFEGRISPASSVNSNKRLEWDNGADIGYSNCRAILPHKSTSLPILTHIGGRDKKDDVDLVGSWEQFLKDLLKGKSDGDKLGNADAKNNDDARGLISSNFSSAVTGSTTESKEKCSVTSSSTYPSDHPVEATTSSSSSNQPRSVSTTSKSEDTSENERERLRNLNSIKRKIGKPMAESTPNLPETVKNYAETPLNVKPEKPPRKFQREIGELSDELIFTRPRIRGGGKKKQKSSSEDTQEEVELSRREIYLQCDKSLVISRKKSDRIVNLCITKPVAIECVDFHQVASADKLVQTSFDERSDSSSSGIQVIRIKRRETARENYVEKQTIIWAIHEERDRSEECLEKEPREAKIKSVGAPFEDNTKTEGKQAELNIEEAFRGKPILESHKPQPCEISVAESNKAKISDKTSRKNQPKMEAKGKEKYVPWQTEAKGDEAETSDSMSSKNQAKSEAKQKGVNIAPWGTSGAESNDAKTSDKSSHKNEPKSTKGKGVERLGASEVESNEAKISDKTSLKKQPKAEAEENKKIAPWEIEAESNEASDKTLYNNQPKSEIKLKEMNLTPWKVSEEERDEAIISDKTSHKKQSKPVAEEKRGNLAEDLEDNLNDRKTTKETIARHSSSTESATTASKISSEPLDLRKSSTSGTTDAKPSPTSDKDVDASSKGSKKSSSGTSKTKSDKNGRFRLAHLIGLRQSNDFKINLSASLELIQKVVKSKRYDPKMKKRYIKQILDELINVSHTESSESSELFQPRKPPDDAIHPQEDDTKRNQATSSSENHQQPITNAPPQLESLTIRVKESLPDKEVLLLKQTLHHKIQPAKRSNSAQKLSSEKPKTKHISKSSMSVYQSIPNTDFTASVTDRSSDKNWREDKTVSELILEQAEAVKQASGDHLVDYAKNEKRHQLSWIKNEINHLLKLKGLLEHQSSSGSSLKDDAKTATESEKSDDDGKSEGDPQKVAFSKWQSPYPSPSYHLFPATNQIYPPTDSSGMYGINPPRIKVTTTMDNQSCTECRGCGTLIITSGDATLDFCSSCRSRAHSAYNRRRSMSRPRERSRSSTRLHRSSGKMCKCCGTTVVSYDEDFCSTCRDSKCPKLCSICSMENCICNMSFVPKKPKLVGYGQYKGKDIFPRSTSTTEVQAAATTSSAHQQTVQDKDVQFAKTTKDILLQTAYTKTDAQQQSSEPNQVDQSSATNPPSRSSYTTLEQLKKTVQVEEGSIPYSSRHSCSDSSRAPLNRISTASDASDARNSYFGRKYSSRPSELSDRRPSMHRRLAIAPDEPLQRRRSSCGGFSGSGRRLSSVAEDDIKRRSSCSMIKSLTGTNRTGMNRSSTKDQVFNASTTTGRSIPRNNYYSRPPRKFNDLRGSALIEEEAFFSDLPSLTSEASNPFQLSVRSKGSSTPSSFRTRSMGPRIMNDRNGAQHSAYYSGATQGNTGNFRTFRSPAVNWPFPYPAKASITLGTQTHAWPMQVYQADNDSEQSIYCQCPPDDCENICVDGYDCLAEFGTSCLEDVSPPMKMYKPQMMAAPVKPRRPSRCVCPSPECRFRCRSGVDCMGNVGSDCADRSTQANCTCGADECSRICVDDDNGRDKKNNGPMISINLCGCSKGTSTCVDRGSSTPAKCPAEQGIQVSVNGTNIGITTEQCTNSKATCCDMVQTTDECLECNRPSPPPCCPSEPPPPPCCHSEPPPPPCCPSEPPPPPCCPIEPPPCRSIEPLPCCPSKPPPCPKEPPRCKCCRIQCCEEPVSRDVVISCQMPPPCYPPPARRSQDAGCQCVKPSHMGSQTRGKGKKLSSKSRKAPSCKCSEPPSCCVSSGDDDYDFDDERCRCKKPRKKKKPPLCSCWPPGNGYPPNYYNPYSGYNYYQQHPCYTLVRNDILSQIKDTIGDLQRINECEQFCECIEMGDGEKHIKTCVCKFKDGKTGRGGIGYMLTLEECAPEDLEDEGEEEEQKSCCALPEITVKVPRPGMKSTKDQRNAQLKKTCGARDVDEGVDDCCQTMKNKGKERVLPVQRDPSTLIQKYSTSGAEASPSDYDEGPSYRRCRSCSPGDTDTSPAADGTSPDEMFTSPGDYSCGEVGSANVRSSGSGRRWSDRLGSASPERKRSTVRYADETSAESDERRRKTNSVGVEASCCASKSRSYDDGRRNGDYDGRKSGDSAGRRSADSAGLRSREYDGRTSCHYEGRGSADYNGRRSADYDGRKSADYDGRKSADYDGRRSADYEGRRSPDCCGRKNADYEKQKNATCGIRKSADHDGRGSADYEGRRSAEYDGAVRDGLRSPDYNERKSTDYSARKSADYDGRGSADYDGRGSADYDGRGSADYDARRSADYAAGRSTDYDGRREYDDQRDEIYDGRGSKSYDDKRDMNGDVRESKIYEEKRSTVSRGRESRESEKPGRDYSRGLAPCLECCRKGGNKDSVCLNKDCKKRRQQQLNAEVHYDKPRSCTEWSMVETKPMGRALRCIRTCKTYDECTRNRNCRQSFYMSVDSKTCAKLPSSPPAQCKPCLVPEPKKEVEICKPCGGTCRETPPPPPPSRRTSGTPSCFMCHQPLKPTTKPSVSPSPKSPKPSKRAISPRPPPPFNPLTATDESDDVCESCKAKCKCYEMFTNPSKETTWTRKCNDPNEAALRPFPSRMETKRPSISNTVAAIGRWAKGNLRPKSADIIKPASIDPKSLKRDPFELPRKSQTPKEGPKVVVESSCRPKSAGFTRLTCGTVSSAPCPYLPKLPEKEPEPKPRKRSTSRSPGRIKDKQKKPTPKPKIKPTPSSSKYAQMLPTPKPMANQGRQCKECLRYEIRPGSKCATKVTCVEGRNVACQKLADPTTSATSGSASSEKNLRTTTYLASVDTDNPFKGENLPRSAPAKCGVESENTTAPKKNTKIPLKPQVRYKSKASILTPVREHLERNRPRFIKSAESRRRFILAAAAKREKLKEKRKLKILMGEKENLDEENSGEMHLFSSKEIRMINERAYNKLPEVQSRLIEQRKQRLKQARKLVSSRFNENLKRNVLKGKRSLPLEAKVIDF